MKKTYDYLIVGAGLFGAVFAQQAKKQNKTCLVIEKRNHIAGNIYTRNHKGIQVHQYGAHIFHTSNKEVWEYVNQFADFKPFVNAPIAVYKDEVYNLPFNMNTFYSMWGVRTPQEAKEKIQSQIAHLNIKEPKNLEEQALSLVGIDVYEKLIKGYTMKQWGRPCNQLPAFIIKRLPLRFTYDNNYFNDNYQGIPEGGYTAFVERLLDGVEVVLNTSYDSFLKTHPNIAKKVVYTGMIDEYFKYQLGALEYRSLSFEEQEYPTENYQGNAVVNYTDAQVKYTRMIEHKHFEAHTEAKEVASNITVVSREFPTEWKQGDEPYYPVNDKKNEMLYQAYQQLAKQEAHVIFGGRLGHYRYYDMDKVIETALKTAKEELGER